MAHLTKTRTFVLAALAGAAASTTAHAQLYERAIGDDLEQRADWVIFDPIDATAPASVHAGWSGDTIAADMYIARLKGNGDTDWDTIIGNAGFTDVANRVEFIPNPSGYLVAGETNAFPPGAAPMGISLTRLDAFGVMMWSQLYQGHPFVGGSFGGTGMDVLGADRIALCGRLQLQQFADQGAVVHHIDASGAQIWGKYYADAAIGPPSFCSFHDVHYVTDADGTAAIVAVGYAAPASFASRDTLVVKLDMAGNVIWSNTYGPPAHTDVAMGLEPAANGDYIITGYTKEAGEGGGTYIARLRPDGTLLWWKDYRFIEASGSIHEEPSGNIVVTGNARDFAGTEDVALMQVDSVGNLNWVRSFGGDQREFAEACDLSPDGYVMTAWSESFLNGPWDLYALAADSAGATGCDRDWNVIVTPRNVPTTPRLFRGHDIPGQVTPPFEQFFPFFPNDPVCDPDPCPDCAADFAPPLGVADFSDVFAFLALFSAMDPCADLAPPIGSFDFSDIAAFLASFTAGCP